MNAQCGGLIPQKPVSLTMPKKLFSAINDRAPGRFKTRAVADEKLIEYDCRVERKEEGCAFLKLPQFPSAVFASRAESDPSEWGKLYREAQATCILAFNRRGVCAVSVRLCS